MTLSKIMKQHIEENKTTLKQYDKDVLIDRIIALEIRDIEENKRLDSLDSYFNSILSFISDKYTDITIQHIKEHKSHILYGDL